MVTSLDASFTARKRILQARVLIVEGAHEKGIRQLDEASRLRNLSATDCQRDPSRVGSGFGKNVSNWVGRDSAYPTNVLHLATECANRGHSAAFPQALPEWFIRLFTEPGDLVLDPFLGSGTTALAAMSLGRAWCGMEALPGHVAQAEAALAEQERSLAARLAPAVARQLKLGAAD